MDEFQWLFTALLVVGGWKVLMTLLRALRFLYLILTPGYNLLERYKTRDGRRAYAVVTGASHGLGRAFSEQLARLGFNLVLCGLNDAEMAEVAAACREINPNIVLKAFGMDFSEATPNEIRQRFQQALVDTEVTVFINNAGIAPPSARVVDWEEGDLANAHRAVQINVLGAVAVASVVLPRMAATARHGGVVNVASASALNGFFYNAVYAGTKGFMRAYSLSVGEELRDTKQFDVLTLTPYFFHSNMVNADRSPVVATAQQVARGALAALGRRSEAMGAIQHELLRVVSDTMRPVMFLLMRKVIGTMIKQGYERRKKFD